MSAGSQSARAERAERSRQPERSAKRGATSRGGGVPAALTEVRGEPLEKGVIACVY